MDLKDKAGTEGSWREPHHLLTWGLVLKEWRQEQGNCGAREMCWREAGESRQFREVPKARLEG